VSAEKPDDVLSVEVKIEPVTPQDPSRLSHLAQNHRLIVRRALLASALGGLVPVPLLDDIVSGRVRAGLYMKLAACRQVDLPAASAGVLAQGKASSALRSITLAAVTLAALKLAGRKFFALLAAGRSAEDMATIFQVATLVDHYCAKLHVGGPVSQPQAAELRAMVHQSVSRTSKTKLVAAFREGARFWVARWRKHRAGYRAVCLATPSAGCVPAAIPKSCLPFGRSTRTMRRGPGSIALPTQWKNGWPLWATGTWADSSTISKSAGANAQRRRASFFHHREHRGHRAGSEARKGWDPVCPNPFFIRSLCSLCSLWLIS